MKSGFGGRAGARPFFILNSQFFIDLRYARVTGAPVCSPISLAINGFSVSPVLGRTKSPLSADQSSLKLVERAEIHIWLTAEFGEMTKRPGGSSKEMWMAPPASSTSKSAS